VKQIHHEELENGDKERPSAFPKIMLKQTDSDIQQLHGAGERTQGQQRRCRLLVESRLRATKLAGLSTATLNQICPGYRVRARTAQSIQAGTSSDSARCLLRTEQGSSASNGSNVDGENGAGSQLHHPIGCRTKHRKIQSPTATHSHSH
jgi:hypothetical protein